MAGNVQPTRLVRTVGSSHGRCNICGEVGALTADHTPPKCVAPPGKLQIRHAIQILADDHSDQTYTQTQNGINYRTLCGRCNNFVLGQRHDPAFADFVTEVREKLSEQGNEVVFDVRIQPQRVVRSVVGHLAAQGIDRFEEGNFANVLREFILDESKPFPPGMRVYYWLYPFHRQVVTRDLAIANLATGQTFTIWMMKFFPVALVIAWDDGELPGRNVCTLDPWAEVAIDHVADVSVRMTNVPHEYWPEAPTKSSVVIYGQDAVMANPPQNSA